MRNKSIASKVVAKPQLAVNPLQSTSPAAMMSLRL
jgi:hypothetical protein